MVSAARRVDDEGIENDCVRNSIAASIGERDDDDERTNDVCATTETASRSPSRVKDGGSSRRLRRTQSCRRCDFAAPHCVASRRSAVQCIALHCSTRRSVRCAFPGMA